MIVTVNDSATYDGTVHGTDPVRDLAVVSICCGRFHSLPFGDASVLEPGDEVVAIGYALGLSGQATITRGIVSALRYYSQRLSDVIQTDAAINPGNSGGPMLSMSGEILGINTFVYAGTAIEGLGFAISVKTVQQQIPSLRTGRPAARPTPTPRRPLPMPSAGGGNIYGPASGELRHDPSGGFIRSARTNVHLADTIMSVTFHNPYSAASHSWDYGFIFRKESDGPEVHLVVASDGRWRLYWRERGNSGSQDISSGGLVAFETDKGGSNRLWVAAVEERGYFFVNGEFISELDLSAVTGAGDVLIATGIDTGTERAGAVTRYEDFTVARLQKEYGPATGTFEYEEGFTHSKHDSRARTSDLVAEATFISPPGSEWVYGFNIRRSESVRGELIHVSGNNYWQHDTWHVGDDVSTNVAGGRLRSDLRRTNHLLLLAIGDTGMFFVNGELVSRLDLSHNLDYGDVIAYGASANDYTVEPSFTNFNVWTPQP